MAAMAARALREESISCGLMNIIPIQVFIVRLIVDQLDEREVRERRVAAVSAAFRGRIKRDQNTT
jgi:hypothetical protein